MATPLLDTAIAASNNGSNIFVYFQSEDGSVVEHNYRSSKKSWKQSLHAPLGVGEARLFTPLAANVEINDELETSEVCYMDLTIYVCIGG